MPWRGSVKKIILLHTHFILSQNFTNNFFSSHHSQFTRDILAASLSRTETVQPFVECSCTVPTFVVISSVSLLLTQYCVGGKIEKNELGGACGVHRVLLGKPEGKRSLGRPRRRWEDNIKMDLREVGRGGDWMELAQVLYPGARGGSRATSCTPHLIMCMLFCSLVWYAYNGGNGRFL